MANKEHLGIIRQGVEVWNRWREENPEIIPDLDGADLNGANLGEADLFMADLREANLNSAYLRRTNLKGSILNWATLVEADLSETNLIEADLIGANQRGADLERADLMGANLRGADLGGAYLWGVNLMGADLRKANLKGASLIQAQLVETKIMGTALTNCKIYGISAWRLKGIPEDQSNLIITRYGEPIITVDNLEVAQFIYLLLHSPKIRDVIDTIAKKAVLILGRFNETQKPVLEAIRNELRKHDYLPIEDFDYPAIGVL